MEAAGKTIDRLDKIEQKFEKVDGKLRVIMKDVSKMEGRVSVMPGTWQLLTMIVGIMSFAFALPSAMIRFGITN